MDPTDAISHPSDVTSEALHAVVHEAQARMQARMQARIAPTPAAPSPALELNIRVQLDRRRRAKCPVCGHRRILFALTAYAVDQPIGYGSAKCLADAGLRVPRL